MPSYAASSNFLEELKDVVDYVSGSNAVGWVREFGFTAFLFDRMALPCGAQPKR